MQFVHFEAFENRHFLMSAEEISIHHQLGIDCEIKESNLENLDLDNNFTICYGKFLCQPEHKKNENILKYINLNKKCGLFCIIDTNIDKRTIEISYLCYADIKLYERDHLGWIPFSALIYGEEKAINHIKNRSNSRNATECTFRIGKDPIIIDIFNRSGVFAIKSIENRIPKTQQITLENWLSFVDDERAVSTAKNIF